MVAKDQVPRTYKDLLNPKWKGNIAVDNEPYSWYVISLAYLEKRDGKEAAADYMKKLAAQQIQWRKGHSLIGQLMAAGEFPSQRSCKCTRWSAAKRPARRWNGRRSTA
jgi:iron(III) transport system substrate-binding protein